MRKATSRISTILLTFALVFTTLPMGSLTAEAATNSLSASATQTSVTLKWTKLTKKQQKKTSGLAVFRNGSVLKRISKKSASYTDSGLAAGTAYSYQIKSYKTSKKWYNKKTKKWQTKKPKKKYRGSSKTVYKYSKVTSAASVTTEGEAASANSTSTTPSTGLSDDERNTPTINATLYVKNNATTGYYSYIDVAWNTYGGSWFITYTLYRNGEKIKDFDRDTKSYKDEDLEWDTTYTYQVSSTVEGVERFSPVKTVTVPSEPEQEEKKIEYLSPDDGYWADTSDAYDVLNEFRMTAENQWYYDKAGNVKTLTNMYELQRDETYEALAKARAKERWTAYYAEDGNFDSANPHMGIDSAYKGTKYISECLYWNAKNLNVRNVIYGNYVSSYDYYPGWTEFNMPYYGQGHRRIMLNQEATKAGIACFQVENTQCWVLVIGK